MIRGQDLPNDRLYEPAHIAEVWADLQLGFTDYFTTLTPVLEQRMSDAVEKFESEQGRYQELLDAERLEEFAHDPNAFKGTLRHDCPIIRRCLMSPAQVMDAYRKNFNKLGGKPMLAVSAAISEFAAQSMLSFDANQQLLVAHPSELNYSILDTEPFTALGVIGGGIRSHFLFNLHPQAFPNRSQNAVWALYFLSGRKNYGYEDDSEFLMIDSDGAGTQQNFFYPYDLFSYYAIKLYQLLEPACQKRRYYFAATLRYVYLNAFLDHVAESHRADIDVLKPQYEQFD